MQQHDLAAGQHGAAPVVDSEAWSYLQTLLEHAFTHHQAVMVPLHTRADGNCLLHAASLAVWGIESWSIYLRHACLQELLNFKDWYVKSLELTNLSGEYAVLLEELRAPIGRDSFLQITVCAVLSNVLRRPVVVCASLEEMQAPHPVDALGVPRNYGTFLPKRIDREHWATESPIVLAWNHSSHQHFVPLVAVEGLGAAQVPVFPVRPTETPTVGVKRSQSGRHIAEPQYLWALPDEFAEQCWDHPQNSFSALPTAFFPQYQRLLECLRSGLFTESDVKFLRGERVVEELPFGTPMADTILVLKDTLAPQDVLLSPREHRQWVDVLQRLNRCIMDSNRGGNLDGQGNLRRINLNDGFALPALCSSRPAEQVLEVFLAMGWRQVARTSSGVRAVERMVATHLDAMQGGFPWLASDEACAKAFHIFQETIQRVLCTPVWVRSEDPDDTHLRVLVWNAVQNRAEEYDAAVTIRLPFKERVASLGEEGMQEYEVVVTFNEKDDEMRLAWDRTLCRHCPEECLKQDVFTGVFGMSHEVMFCTVFAPRVVDAHGRLKQQRGAQVQQQDLAAQSASSVCHEMRQRQLQSLLEAPEAMPAEGRIELISSLTTEERATYRNVVKRGGNQDLLEEYIAVQLSLHWEETPSASRLSSAQNPSVAAGTGSLPGSRILYRQPSDVDVSEFHSVENCVLHQTPGAANGSQVAGSCAAPQAERILPSGEEAAQPSWARWLVDAIVQKYAGDDVGVGSDGKLDRASAGPSAAPAGMAETNVDGLDETATVERDTDFRFSGLEQLSRQSSLMSELEQRQLEEALALSLQPGEAV